MKKLLLVFAVLSASSTFAAVIEDPNGLLKQLDASRAKADFADAFRMDDQVTLRLFNADCKWGCGEDGCGSVCTVINSDFDKKLVEVTPDNATAAQTDGSTTVYDRAEYEAAGNQSLKTALEGLDVFLGMNGKVVLKSLAPIDFALADGTKIPAFDLKGEFVVPVNSMEIEFQVARGAVPGMAEILFEKIGGFHGEGGDKIFKIKAVSRK